MQDRFTSCARIINKNTCNDLNLPSIRCNIKKRFSFTDSAHCVNLNSRLKDCNYNTTTTTTTTTKIRD